MFRTRYSHVNAVLAKCEKVKALALKTVKLGPVNWKLSYGARAICPVPGLAPYVADGKDAESLREALFARLGLEMPEIDNALMRRLRSFNRVFLAQNFEPLPPGTDFSVETWLAGTSYTQKQKDHFLYIYACMLAGRDLGSCKDYDVTVKFLMVFYGQYDPERGTIRWQLGMAAMVANFKPKWYKCKSFGKVEFMMEVKHVRWINSRSDQFKILSGPIFKHIEHEVFKHPFFIKKIPLTDRSAYIHKLMYVPGGIYFATDYSKFEAAFHPKLVRAVELQLYKYMTIRNPQVKDAVNLIGNALTMKQKIRSKYCKATVEGRMSGDMCTSLGNGYTNLVLAAFWAHECGFEPCGIFEGDDGIVRVPSRELIPPATFYERLGFKIKIEPSGKLNEAGFCKIFYAEGEPENLRNPIETVLKAGWTKSARMHGGNEVMRELARSQGFAILCETPACPISAAMGLYLLRATEGSVASPLEGWWEHQRFKNTNLEKCIERALEGPSTAQRKFVSDKWGIPPAHQEHIENYFNSLSVLQELSDPILMQHCYQQCPAWRIAGRSLTTIKPKGSAW